MLGNYLQQTTSDDIFICIFFFCVLRIDSLSTKMYQCRLLITLVNSLDPDQVWQIFEPDQGTNCLTLGYIVLCLKEILQKKYFEEKSADEITKKTGTYKVTFAHNYAQQLRFWIWRFCVHSVYQSRLLKPWKTVWTQIRPAKNFRARSWSKLFDFIFERTFKKKGGFLRKSTDAQKAWKLPRQVLKKETEAWRFVQS